MHNNTNIRRPTYKFLCSVTPASTSSSKKRPRSSSETVSHWSDEEIVADGLDSWKGTCAVWMALCRASKMALNRSIYWLLSANTSEYYLYTEQMGVKCIIVNHAVLRYFICSRQPYYGWWFYFLVNNAASGKLSTISPALVPKNAAEVDALLNASQAIRVYVLAYFAYIAYFVYIEYGLFAG